MYDLPSVHYTLSMPEPSTHYFQVEILFSDLQHPAIQAQGYLDLRMPVWIPGSYMIREYARHIDSLSAFADDLPVSVKKIRKNAWRIPVGTAGQLRVTYQLYANELTVRTNFLDSEHGYANGAATFAYAEEFRNEPATLTIRPYEGWNTVSVALPAIETHTYLAANYDILADSPIEIGNHTEWTFEACGIPHRVAMVGEYATISESKLLSDYIRICEAAATVINRPHPCREYLFIVHHTAQNGSGGLEHLSSTTLHTHRNTYANEAAYGHFLGLVAHEYFHLWNVKRIRPVELGPFNYEEENYTRQLWVAEGFTSLFDNHILRRAKISSVEKYLEDVAADFNYVQNTPGAQVQSLADASFDAWIKYYRQTENSVNSQVSYYVKGAAVSTLLNLEIIHETAGEKSLDDVLRLLYDEYYLRLNRGFSEEELQATVEQVAGKSLKTFFESAIYGTESLDFQHYLNYAGCRLINDPGDGGFLGAVFAPGKPVISAVLRDSPAWQAGLNAFDEITAIDDTGISDIPRHLETREPGERLRLEIRRAGRVLVAEVELIPSPLVRWRIVRTDTVTPAQETVFRKWVWA